MRVATAWRSHRMTRAMALDRLPHRVACCSACLTHCWLDPALFIMQLRMTCSENRVAVSTQEARPTHVDVRDIAALVNHRMRCGLHAARMRGD